MPTADPHLLTAGLSACGVLGNSNWWVFRWTVGREATAASPGRSDQCQDSAGDQETCT